MAVRDHDYYATLGVPRTATAEEIKSAYRARAKEVHPDRNRGRNATERFQRLQEAYSVLGSPERRELYDRGRVAEAKDPETKATEVDFDPIPCSSCGCVSAQPRFVQYDRVVSVFAGVIHHRPSGCFCPSCAAKKLLSNTLITGTIGLLSVPGIFVSARGIWRNVSGGFLPAGLNAFLLGKQAIFFQHGGKIQLARALATDALEFSKKCLASDQKDYALGCIGAAAAEAILTQAGAEGVRLRSRWTGWSSPAAFAILGLLLAAGFWTGVTIVAIDLLNSPRRRDSTSGRAVENVYHPSPIRSQTTETTESEVNLVDRDGKTYRVSSSDYLRLKPIYDELGRQRSLLRSRSEELSAEAAQIEAKRIELDGTNSAAVEVFNWKVDSWNRQQERFMRNAGEVEREVDAYNLELHRVGRKVR